MGRESHHCVEREKKRVQQEPSDVIEPLVVEDPHAEIVFTWRALIAALVAMSVGASIGPAGVGGSLGLVLDE
jgi:hypothetical protein